MSRQENCHASPEAQAAAACFAAVTPSTLVLAALGAGAAFGFFFFSPPVLACGRGVGSCFFDAFFGCGRAEAVGRALAAL